MICKTYIISIYLQQKHTDPATKQLLDILHEPCEQLEIQLQKIVDLTEELKGR